MAMSPADRFRRIIVEIRQELSNLARLHAEWQGIDPETGSHTIILRGEGSIFHDFYCGAERIFRAIADEVNGGVPAGESWHRLLLQDMRLEIPGLRPAVISQATHEVLVDFLNFRHKFRNIYGFDLEPERVDEVEREFPEAHKQLVADLEVFLQFLENMATSGTSSGT